MFEKELEIAMKAAYAVRDVVLDVYNSTDLGIEIKEDNSPVTKADKAADKIIRALLSKEFPDYALLTEESVDNKERLNNDFVWIVDPVDGTKDFVSKNNEFTVNIGLAYKHEPVLGIVFIPVSGEIYFGVKGLGSFYQKDENSEPIRIYCNKKRTDLTVVGSRFHFTKEEQSLIDKHADVIKHKITVGAAIKGCLIAKGEAEMHYRTSSNTKEWDTCAMQAIVEQAGGIMVKFDGSPIKYNRDDVYNHSGYVICNIKDNFLI